MAPPRGDWRWEMGNVGRKVSSQGALIICYPNDLARLLLNRVTRQLVVVGGKKV